MLALTTASFTSALKTKLDGIEAGATADQSPAQIKTAYEGVADTNAYTDADKTKLAGLNIATQAQAETGLNNTKLMTSLRVAQAIAAAPILPPDTVGTPYHGIHPYNGVLVGDGTTGLFYDKAIDGNASSVQTPNFEPGYTYVVYLRDYSYTGATGTESPKVTWYNASNAVVAGPASFGTGR
ncbi:MAG: hypothetical protein HRU33_09215 [Rhodobacteraceae bacterium]|nr:hypothetical protein [Paracoccaceae bacterium]